MEWSNLWTSCDGAFLDSMMGKQIYARVKHNQHMMSNYLLTISTNKTTCWCNNGSVKAREKFVPWYFHPILNEGEDGNNNNNKVDIKPYYIEWLYGVMMTRMLQGNMSVPDMNSSRSWFKHNIQAVNNMP